MALIPARGGSRSVPRKNVRLLAGHPLIAHSIAAALRSKTITRTIVSTDDEEIAQAARHYGAEVPFLRPTDLALDTTPDLPVFQHALRWLGENEQYRPEIIVHLRPTSPLRSATHVDEAVRLLISSPEADSVRSVTQPSQNPYKMWRIAEDGWLKQLLSSDTPEPYNQPRQVLPPVYWQTGTVDVTRWRTVMERQSMTGEHVLPLVLEGTGWIDIDTEDSIALAEWFFQTGRIQSHVPPGDRDRANGERTASGVLSDVRMLVLDFDGVLTDNRVWVTEDGKEATVFDRSDGMGIQMLRRAGIDVLVLSSETNRIVERRCQKLGIAYRQGVTEKHAVLKEWMDGRRIDPRQVAYVGNDVNDIDCLQLVGVPAAVADAHPEVLARARVVLTKPGGRGAVREVCDLIISAREARKAERGMV